MTKGVDERIDESDLLWFVSIERMRNGRITKRVYEEGMCRWSFDRSTGEEKRFRCRADEEKGA